MYRIRFLLFLARPLMWLIEKIVAPLSTRWYSDKEFRETHFLLPAVFESWDKAIDHLNGLFSAAVMNVSPQFWLDHHVNPGMREDAERWIEKMREDARQPDNPLRAVLDMLAEKGIKPDAINLMSSDQETADKIRKVLNLTDEEADLLNIVIDPNLSEDDDDDVDPWGEDDDDDSGPPDDEPLLTQLARKGVTALDQSEN